MGLDGHGSDAGTAAAVRDAEGLVEVEVGDIAAVVAGATEADLQEEVRMGRVRHRSEEKHAREFYPSRYLYAIDGC